jgi:hypothetical protein
MDGTKPTNNSGRQTQVFKLLQQSELIEPQLAL